MNRPSEELLHKTLENRATAAEAASVAEWLATDSGQAWASRYIGRDFDRQEACGDCEQAEVDSERIFTRIKSTLTRGRRRRILFRVAAVVIPVVLVLGVALRLDRQVGGIFSAAEYDEFVVDRGRRTQCLFQDGSIAYLNSESKIMVMMPKVVGVVLDQMTRIVRFWSFAFLNNSIIAVQEKIPLYKVLKMLFRESAMDS